MKHARPGRVAGSLIAMLLSGAISAVAQGGEPAAGGATPDHPNVLFLAVDDLNDWVGALGGNPQALTPNIDRLARRGVIFTNAHTSSPLCTPSRESLLTGRQPFTLQYYNLFPAPGQTLPRFDHLTLPEHFRANGYETLGAGKIFHADPYLEVWDDYGPGIGASGGPFTREELSRSRQNPTHEVDRGPGELKATLPFNRMPDDRRAYEPNGLNTFDWGPVDLPDEDFADGQIAAWAIDQLERPHDGPFFLGVGFFRPHQPLFTPSRYFEPFPTEEIILPEVPSRDLDDVPPVGRAIALQPLTGGRHSTVVGYEQWKGAVRGYLASIYFVDTLIGRVLDALEASPHADNTIIVLWSDHGYHLGQKEHWGKWTGWEASTHVPLVFVPASNQGLEGFEPGGRAGSPVSLLDLYPTLVELAGLERPAGLEGRSLMPLLRDPTLEWDAPVITTFGRGNHTIRDARWHYIHYFDGTRELYDLSTDPNLWTNVAERAENASTVARLSRSLPPYPEVAHFVRMDEWKAVLYTDGSPPELFRLGPTETGENVNLADDHPDVLARIQDRIRDRPDAPKYLTLPWMERTALAPSDR